MGVELLLGAVVSGIIQVTKKWLPGGRLSVIAVVAFLSLVAATVFTFAPSVWEGAVAVFAAAGAFYAYVISTVEPSK